MARPTQYAPLPEPGFAAEVAKGHRPALRAVLSVLAHRIDAGVSIRDLPALVTLAQLVSRELAARDDDAPESPAARLARELASETPA